MKYIVANWKMNLGVRESIALARGVIRELRGTENLPQVIICPPFTALSEVHKSIARSRVSLGAQNAGPHERAGSFTGEISPAQLEDLHCAYVLLGHSERRHLGESDVLIRQKLQATFASRLTPILCIGESRTQKEAGQTFAVLDEQLASAFKHLDIPARRAIIVAYEPVWAIGTGDMPTMADIIEIHQHIRDVLAGHTQRSLDQVAVLYGGSVTEENAYQLLRESEVDGILVGGASLKLHAFGKIMQAGVDVMIAQSN